MNKNTIRKQKIATYYAKKCQEYKDKGDQPSLCYQRCHQRVRGVKFIGTFEEFKERMESYFTPEGYNWDNYGEWEIDHIIPLNKGGEHNVNNLQPLWFTPNRQKR